MPTSLDDIDEYCKLSIDPYLSTDESFPHKHNTVGTSFYDIDNVILKQFVGAVGIASYHNARLNASAFRNYRPDNGYGEKAPTVQFFDNGWSVFMGAPNAWCILKYIHILRFLLYNLPFIERRPDNSRLWVSNEVSTGSCKPLDIETFENKSRLNVIKNAKSFPGIVYIAKVRGYPNHSLSFSLFSTGKMNVMGFCPLREKNIFTFIFDILERNYSHIDDQPYAKWSITALRDALLYDHDPSKESYCQLVKRIFNSVQQKYQEEDNLLSIQQQQTEKISNDIVDNDNNDEKDNNYVVELEKPLKKGKKNTKKQKSTDNNDNNSTTNTRKTRKRSIYKKTSLFSSTLTSNTTKNQRKRNVNSISSSSSINPLNNDDNNEDEEDNDDDVNNNTSSSDDDEDDELSLLFSPTSSPLNNNNNDDIFYGNNNDDDDIFYGNNNYYYNNNSDNDNYYSNSDNDYYE